MIGVRDLRENAVELLHLWRLADEVAGALLVAQPFAQAAAFEIEVTAFAGALQYFDQLFEREGFGEVIARAHAHGFDRVRYRSERRHDDYASLRL